MNFLKYTPNLETEILSFCDTHPSKRSWTREFRRNFINELISSPTLVLDLHENGERIAVAVLLDRVKNLGNHANLEILGIKDGLDVEKVYELFIHQAGLVCPKDKFGIELSLSQPLPFTEGFFARNQLDSYFDLYDMIQPHILEGADPSDAHVQPLKSENLHELYLLIQDCFQNSPDANIPEYEHWLKMRKENLSLRTWIYWDGPQMIGFINIRLPEEGDTSAHIRMLGVRHSHRDHGIGKMLLKKALFELKNRGVHTAHLSVASQNEGALTLYLNLGFQIVKHSTIFKKRFPL